MFRLCRAVLQRLRAGGLSLLDAGEKQNNNQAENKRYRQQAEGKDDQVAVDVGHVGYFPMNM